MRKDGQKHVTKLIVAFHKFAKEPKKQLQAEITSDSFLQQAVKPILLLSLNFRIEIYFR
jgi:hypothetical protein